MAITTLAQITALYHFTDRRNIESIKRLGGLLPYSILLESGVAIPAAGGNDWSHEADVIRGVHGDVHLCLRNSHPMEHVARQEGRISEVVYLQIDASVLQWPGVRFTSDVANKAGVVPIPIANAEPMIDFQVLYTHTDWKDPAILERLKQAEKCEVLVPHVIPLGLIRNI